MFGLESMLIINVGKGKYVDGFSGAPGMNDLIFGGDHARKGALSILYSLGANVTIIDINIGILRFLDDKYQSRIYFLFCNKATIVSILPWIWLLIP